MVQIANPRLEGLRRLHDFAAKAGADPVTAECDRPSHARPVLRGCRTVAYLVCILYVLALAYPARLHLVGAFSDFYRWYAPDADRIAAGEFPQNTFNPPGFPVLLALASRLTGDHFTSGKWMSVLGGGIVGILAFHLLRRLFGPAPALLAVPIILLSGEFTVYSIQATSDIPFLCVCLGALLVITTARPEGWRATVLSGGLCGLAYLVRYNGVFLLVPGLIGVIWQTGSKTWRATLSALYLGSFLLTAAPWWWLNYTHHGSPVYSTNYEDVARALAVYGDGRELKSVVDVFLTAPGRFALAYARRIVPTLYKTFSAGLVLVPVGPLAALGIVLSLARHRRRPVLLVLIAALSYLLVMSLTHWMTRYFFLFVVCYGGFAAFAIFEVAGAIERAFHAPMAGRATAIVLALWILVPSGARSVSRIRAIIERQPIELLAAAKYLDRVAPAEATVMARKPNVAYLSHRQWRELPDVRTLDELRAFLLRERPPDYLVYDRMALRFTPHLSVLANSDGDLGWLQRVYRDPPGVVMIYAVRMNTR